MHRDTLCGHILTKIQSLFLWIFVLQIVGLGFAQESTQKEPANDGALLGESNTPTLAKQIDIGDNVLVRVDEIVLDIDDFMYNNPGKGMDFNRRTTHPLLVMREISFRKGDSYKFSSFKKKLYYSKLNLENSKFLYTGSTIDYEVVDDTDAIKGLKVIIRTKEEYTYSFGGGFAYLFFGTRHPFGLTTENYLGLNRIETNYEYSNINIDGTPDSYSRIFMDIGIKNSLYYLSTRLYDPINNDVIYGGVNPYLAVSPLHQLKIKVGLGYYAVYSLNERLLTKHYDAPTSGTLLNDGLPTSSEGSVQTLDARTSLEIAQVFAIPGMFQSYIKATIPYTVGTVLSSYEPEFNQWDMYDLISPSLDLQYATKLLIHAALRLRFAYLGAFINTANPFVARVNTGDHFYDYLTSGIDWIRRNTIYTNLSPYQQHAIAARIALRLGYAHNTIGYETLFYYETSTSLTPNENLDGLGENLRHIFGPAFLLHVGPPLNLVLRFDFALGGPLLEVDEGVPFSFRFNIFQKK